MIGQTISHYRILEKLGEGGMGVVYKAEDQKLKRTVALKFLPAELTRDAEAKLRFTQEAQAASALQHINVCNIHDIDETADGQIFIVMDCYEGMSLKQKLVDRLMNLKQIIEIAVQIASGLSKAHEKGIVHRDIKPANIFITDDGIVKLLDFGLAKLAGQNSTTKEPTTPGTVAYMSPEQARGTDVDRRTDIWSLGIVLYEIATGTKPFRSEYEQGLIYAILNEEPPAVRAVRPEIPPELAEVIHRAMQKDKTKRFQKAEEMITQLRTVKHQLSNGAKIHKKTGIVRWIAAAVVVILALISIYLWYPLSAPPAAGQKSIAVLPFKNLSDSREDEYFTDGITEDILTQLSKISDLKVISRTTMMQYKNTQKSLREIGDELKVGVVLEGSVRHAGERIRITSQLIDAREDKHLWAETYDRELKDIFAIQSDVARQIASALKAELTPGEKERIEKKQTENTEAYQLYLKGRFYWNKRTIPDLQKSIEYYNKAIGKDPVYALAYAGLANAYVILPAFGCSSNENYPKAQIEAIKALELDSTLAEAHAVLAQLKENNYDYVNAEREYKRAIELNRNYPTAHQWYGLLLGRLGRFDEAMAEARRAVELDPLSLIINYSLGWTQFCMRQYDAAREQGNKGIELDPNFPWNYYLRGLADEAQGNFDEALKEYQKVRILAPDDLTTLGEIGRLYARTGRKVEAVNILNELQTYYRQGFSVCTAIANVYYGLGDKEKTFEWLGRSVDGREGLLLDFMENPLWDSLRTDPRFIFLLQKIGLRK